MKTVFITGAEGFIGSHLVELLVRSGYKVKAYVLYNSFNFWGWLDELSSEIKSEVDIIMGDVRDSHRTEEAMRGSQVVIHLAALIAIPYSYHSPASYVDTNVSGTLNVVQAAKKLNIEKVIHTSTSEVYGTAKFVPITEEHPLRGQSPYSASKIAADQIAMSFYDSFNLPVTILRPFNTYGPRQSNRAIIPTIITQIASGKSAIKLGSLTPTRDLNYVEDTISSFLAAIESNRVIGEVINVGSGYEISIGQLAKLIAEIMSADLNVVEDKKRIRPKNSEVERLLASNEKAADLLHWRPKYSGIPGLKQGLLKTIEWFSDPSNLNLYKTELYAI